MSLSWNVKNVEEHESICYNADGSIKLMTEHLVWATMAVEMGEITEANATEFYARLSVLYALGYSTHIGPAPEHAPLRASAEDVVVHIGLRTNVGTRSRSQWMGRADGYVKGKINDMMITSASQVERLMGVIAAS